MRSDLGSYPHCSVVAHWSSPENPDGSYIFEPAWRYRYGVAELSRRSTARACTVATLAKA